MRLTVIRNKPLHEEAKYDWVQIAMKTGNNKYKLSGPDKLAEISRKYDNERRETMQHILRIRVILREKAARRCFHQ